MKPLSLPKRFIRALNTAMTNRAIRVFRSTLFLTLVAILSPSAKAMPLLELQQRWARAHYQMQGDTRIEAFESLNAAIEHALSEADGPAPSLLIWDGIVKSTWASHIGGLRALPLAKAARKSLEAALAADPDALGGSAYLGLGALYYRVPGWPVAFGDKDKARQHLLRALEANPDGLDSNYFYGDFLAQEGEIEEAITVLEHALKAPPRPGREVADRGRRKEIETLLARLR